MTDVVERLNEAMFDIKDRTRINPDLWNPLALAICDATDEIKRLRTENQELKLQYLSDQGQWIEETGRLRVALERKQRPEAETIDGVIAWIKEDAERLAKARTALGEKE